MTGFTRNIRELDELRRRPLRIVGITGGIGSGKTVATDALRAEGFTVIDADEISRRLFACGTPMEKELARLFPIAAKPDGSLDRRRLRTVIAEDAKSRRRLDEFTHPVITAEIERLLNSAVSASKPIILSAPLLFECALAKLCDATVCIYCPTALRAERIAKRDGISRDDALKIIRAQIPDTERATLADFIIPSDVPVDKFVEETVRLVKELFSDKKQTKIFVPMQD